MKSANETKKQLLITMITANIATLAVYLLLLEIPFISGWGTPIIYGALCSSFMFACILRRPKSNHSMVAIKSYNENEVAMIEHEKIYFIAAAGNYIEIFYESEKGLSKQLIRNKISHVESQLKKHSSLIRCHRTFIVNVDKVTGMDGNMQGFRLALKGIEHMVPVARSHCKRMYNLLKDLLHNPLDELMAA